MTSVIRWLDRVLDAPIDAPLPIEAKAAMQKVTRQAAFEPESWTPDRAAKVGALFDGLADEWDERQGRISRYDALVDALARGDLSRGHCLEVGSGTGLATPYLTPHFDVVIGVDLASKMLAHGSGPRVLGDASVLPVATASFDAAVLVNALLFPAEVDRILKPGGALLWVNTRADDTPIHLPPEDVAAAMPGEWTGAAAEAGLGLWTVLRRSPS